MPSAGQDTVITALSSRVVDCVLHLHESVSIHSGTGTEERFQALSLADPFFATDELRIAIPFTCLPTDDPTKLQWIILTHSSN